MSEDDKNFVFVAVNDSQRLLFNQRYFRNPIFDTKIFDMANLILLDYQGGYWSYMKWKNEVAFYQLEGDKVFTLRNPHSGEEFQLDKALAGMIITSYALNLELEWRPCDELVDQLTALKHLIYEYAEEIGQFEQAFGMID